MLIEMRPLANTEAASEAHGAFVSLLVCLLVYEQDSQIVKTLSFHLR